MRNELVIFQNIHVRLYICQTKEIDINHPGMANGLAKIPVDKPANEEIPMPLDYLKPQRLCQRKRPL